PLAEGLMVDDTVRCPWHHACFSLRTGEALAAPALNPVPCWRIERRQDRVIVREKLADTTPAKAAGASVGSIVILGGGAAGNAAAEMLRREGHAGGITMLSADDSVPYDRPNLSKDYLAGTASEDWIPLRPASFYQEQGIDLVLGARATRIDTAAKRVELADGRRYGFDRLLLATGAEPVRLTMPGADRENVHYLRSLADSRALIAAPRPRIASSSSGRASSGSKWRPRCARAVSKPMSWRRNRGRWSASSGRSSAISSARFTRRMASSFTSARRRRRSMRAASR